VIRRRAQELSRRKETGDGRLHSTDEDLTSMGRLGKIKSPMGLDEWLRRVLREKRPEDRMKIFREWRRVYLRAKLKQEPTEPEVEAEIRLIQEQDALTYPFGFADLLSDFVPVYHQENRRKKAQIAAAKRWSKKNEKRPLT
jgi:hypothetical protein